AARRARQHFADGQALRLPRPPPRRRLTGANRAVAPHSSRRIPPSPSSHADCVPCPLTRCTCRAGHPAPNTSAERLTRLRVPPRGHFSLNLPPQVDDKMDSNARREQPNRFVASRCCVSPPVYAAVRSRGRDLQDRRGLGSICGVDTIGKPVLDLAAIPIRAAPMG